MVATLKWLLVRLVYFMAIAALCEIAGCVVPVLVTYHHFLGKFFLCGVLSHFVFELTKENIFKKRIKSKNKAVFITGCDSGFGKLAAIELDSKGFHVFAGCHFGTPEGAEDLKNRCSDRLRVVKVDVDNDESIEKVKEFIEQNLGYCELWAVVNNAGVSKGLNVDFTKVSDFQKLFDVNALGQVRVTKALLPLLKKSRGRIVNISSVAGRQCIAHMAAYTMSKHASVAFTECLRQEMEDWGIEVISVEPEVFKTKMCDPKKIQRDLQQIIEELDPQTKAEYGQEYFDKVTNALYKTFGVLPSSRIELVTQAIENAVCAQHPCVVYLPCDGVVRKMSFHLFENFVFINDLFLRGYFALFSIPKPIGASRKYK